MRPATHFLRGSSLGLIVGKLLQMGGGFVFWIAAARTATTTSVGLTAALVSTLMLCVLVALLGVGAAATILIHRTAQDGDSHHRIFDDAITFVLISGATIAAAYVSYEVAFGHGMQLLSGDPWLDALFIIAAAFATLGVLLDQISLAYNRGWQCAVRYFGGVAISVTIVWTAAIRDGELTAPELFLAWSIGIFVAVVIGALQLHHTQSYRFRPRLTSHRVLELVRIGSPMQLLTLVERAPSLLVPILVAILVSPETTALWYAAWMAAWAVFTAPVAVGLAHFAEVVKEPQAALQKTREAIRSALIFGGIIGIVPLIAAPQILGLLGPEYAAQAAPALRILILGLVPYTLIQSFDAVCRALGRITEALITGFIGGVVLLSAVLLAAPHGLTAMAVAWVISSLPYAGWASWRLRCLLRSPTPSAYIREDGDGINSSTVPVTPGGS